MRAVLRLGFGVLHSDLDLTWRADPLGHLTRLADPAYAAQHGDVAGAGTAAGDGDQAAAAGGGASAAQRGGEGVGGGGGRARRLDALVTTDMVLTRNQVG